MPVTTDLLEFLRQLIHRATTGGTSGGVQVLPVVIDELSSSAELIEAVVRHAGGVFIDTASCAAGTQGTASPHLLAVVTKAMKVPRLGGGWSQISIRENAGVVISMLDGKGASESTSRGVATILGVGTAFFDRRIHEATFAVMAYDETGLDRDWADVTWRLFTDQVLGTPIGRLRTLVVMVQAPKISYERHCASSVSATYRLGPDGLESRKDRESNLAEIRRLRPHDDELLVLFLGAGFAASSSLPLGNDLRDQALRRLFNSSEPIAEVIEKFHRYIATNQRLLPSEERLPIDRFSPSLTLERVLREEFHRNGVTASPTLTYFRERVASAGMAPGPAVQHLGGLLRHKSNLVLVTVNFDVLIESSEEVEVFAQDEEFERCPKYIREYRKSGGKVPLLKLHGTILQPDTIVATVDAYAGGLAVSKTEALRELVRSGGMTKWVYVGYSMRDPDVTAVLSLQEFGTRLDECWVSPFPVSTARTFTESHRNFDSRPDFWHRCITETADVFIRELASTW